MNYQKHYDNLIGAAKARQQLKSKNVLKQELGYIEFHHIVPRSLGGSNDKTNLVALTAKEHFVAHHLLWKIYKNISMCWAFWFMAHKDNIKITSRIFHNLRINIRHSDEVKNKMKKPKSGTHRVNISIGKKGTPSPFKGVFRSEEVKEKIKLTKSKNLNPYKKPWSEERKASYSKSKTGCILSQDTKDNISKALKGRPQRRVSCVYCKKEGGLTAMLHYHLDKCKEKTI